MDQSTQKNVESVKMLSMSTLDLLRCFHCKQYLSSAPVYSFDNGINLCAVCYTKGLNMFANMKHIRNSLYADTVKDLNFPCANSSEGCEAITPFDKPHTQYCMYETCFKCPVAADGFKGNVKVMKNHLRSEHHNILFNINEIYFTITKLTSGYNGYFINIMQLSESSFFIHSQEPKKKSKVICELAGRMFIVTIGGNIRSYGQDCDLRVDIREITPEKCSEKFTLTFKNERNDFMVRYKCQNKDGSIFEKKLNTLFEMSTSTRLFFTISIDISDRNSLIEKETTDNGNVSSPESPLNNTTIQY